VPYVPAQPVAPTNWLGMPEVLRNTVVAAAMAEVAMAECAVARSHTRSKAMLGLVSHGLLV
jgi:hypothetical protein